MIGYADAKQCYWYSKSAFYTAAQLAADLPIEIIDKSIDICGTLRAIISWWC